MVKDLLEMLLGTQYKVGASPESFNSQIGVPLSLFSIKKEQEFALIEAAISMPGEMDKLCAMIEPDFTILTELGNKHLATLGSLSGLAECAKMLIGTDPKGWVLVPQSKLLNLSTVQAKIHYWDDENPPHAFKISDEQGSQIPFRVRFPDETSLKGQMTMGYAYYLNLLNITVKAAWNCASLPQISLIY